MSYFFVVFFFDVFALGESLGRPLLPFSRIASRSALLYIPALPMYLKGLIPLRWSLLLTASDAKPNSWAISNTVIVSIHINIRQKNTINQVKKTEFVKMFRQRHLLLYIRIVKHQIFLKILKISFQNLDYPLGREYYLYSYYVPTEERILKRLPESPVAEWLTEAKGDLHERNEKFNGMA
jgi:hypothetical protein